MTGFAGGSSLPPPGGFGGFSGFGALTIGMVALNNKHTINTHSIVFHNLMSIPPFLYNLFLGNPIPKVPTA
jgi:hypothetical protein